MSSINKDTIIQQCADGYRTASGTLAPVKYGELGNKIAELVNAPQETATNVHVDSSVVSGFLPVYIPTATVEINNHVFEVNAGISAQ